MNPASPLTRAVWSAKASLREALRFTLWNSGVARLLARNAGRHRRIVLAYHTVGDQNPAAHPSNVLAEATFVRHLKMITDSGRQVVSLERILDFDRPLPGGGVALTFDDGYRGNLETVAPLLRERQWPATFYVCPGFIDRREGKWDDLVLLNAPEAGKGILREPRATVEAAVAVARTAAPADTLHAHADTLLDWDGLRQLKHLGFSIQSHTTNHLFLTRLHDDDLRGELAGAKMRLDLELGQDTTSLAYPFGFPGCFDEHTKACVRTAGYLNAVKLGNRYLRKRSDPLEIPRFGIHSHLPDWQLRLVLSGAYL